MREKEDKNKDERKMKVSYYSLGNSHIGFKGLFRNLGIETIDPPKITKRTMEFGSEHAPESACYPFKMILGQYKDALENGADTLFFIDSGTAFGCRMHQYIVGINHILKKLGYKFDSIAIGGEYSKKDLFKEIKKANPTLKFSKFITTMFSWIFKTNAVEQLEERCAKIRPYEKNKGDTTLKLFEPGLKWIDQASTIKEIQKAKKLIKRQAKKVETEKNKNIVKILVIGDLFSMVEHQANLNIVERLGNMGVLAIKPYRMSDDFRNPAGLGPWGKRSFKIKERLAKPYLKREIGAGAFRAIGDCIKFIKKVDGVIQIFGFTCMPEIVNQTILNKICKDFNKPIQHLTLGEHDSETSYLTKVEAFVDMLKRQKLEKK